MATPATAVEPQKPAIDPVVPNQTIGRDTSAEAIERNELGIKNNIQQAPAYVAQTPAPEQPSEPAVAQPPVVAEPVRKVLSKEEFDAILDAEAPELINGKYKTLRESVKGYDESQKGFISKVQAEAAKLAETKAAELAEIKLQEKLKTLTATEQTAEIAQSRPLEQMTDDELLDLQVKSPQEFIRMQRQQTIRDIRAADALNNWRKENGDIADMKIEFGGKEYPLGEALVSHFSLALAKDRPDLLADQTGAALLRESTAALRNFVQSERNRGKQEALVIRETVTPLQATVSPSTAPPATPSQAPVTQVDPVEEEVELRRSELKRISGNQSVLRY